MKTFRFIMCVAVGIMLMVGVNSCDNKKKTASVSDSSKEKSESVMSEDEDLSSASESAESTESETPKSDKLVLLDFYATWCGPCKMMTPVMEEMEKKYSDNMEFKKIDIDKDSKLAEKYKIEAVPTFVILSPTGEEIDRVEGAMEEEKMDEILWEIVNNHIVK